MNLKGYVSVRSPVPVSVQNLVLRDYCARNAHTLSLSDVEFLTGSHMLQGMLGYSHLEGICAYSMALVPEDMRALILNAEVPIHFALENYVLPRDRAMCDDIWRLKSLT